MALAWGIKKPFLCTNIGSRTQPKLETPTKLAQPSKQQQRILIQVCKRYLWSLLSGYKSSYVAGTWVSSQAQSHASVQTTRTLDPLVVPLSEPTGSRSFPCSCTVNFLLAHQLPSNTYKAQVVSAYPPTIFKLYHRFHSNLLEGCKRFVSMQALKLTQAHILPSHSWPAC